MRNKQKANLVNLARQDLADGYKATEGVLCENASPHYGEWTAL